MQFSRIGLEDKIIKGFLRETFDGHDYGFLCGEVKRFLWGKKPNYSNYFRCMIALSEFNDFCDLMERIIKKIK